MLCSPPLSLRAGHSLPHPSAVRSSRAYRCCASAPGRSVVRSRPVFLEDSTTILPTRHFFFLARSKISLTVNNRSPYTVLYEPTTASRNNPSLLSEPQTYA